jgi:DNA-binding MarR family transcriptional regulator
VDVLSIRRLDDRVHGKVRLAILTLLSRHGTMSFVALKAATETTDGNLAVHLNKLEAAGFLDLTRDFSGRQRRTNAAITNAGRSAYSAYLTELRAWLNL